MGEIDILAVKNDSYDIYEVKCSHRIVKARKQLKRIKKIFDSGNEKSSVNKLFFFCGGTGEIIDI
ncbi:MAG: hypothetical protein ACQER9_03730 [Nanobdellota archaeon]